MLGLRKKIMSIMIISFRKTHLSWKENYINYDNFFPKNHTWAGKENFVNYGNFFPKNYDNFC